MDVIAEISAYSVFKHGFCGFKAEIRVGDQVSGSLLKGYLQTESWSITVQTKICGKLGIQKPAFYVWIEEYGLNQ